jgi:hypothetical protein
MDGRSVKEDRDKVNRNGKSRARSRVTGHAQKQKIQLFFFFFFCCPGSSQKTLTPSKISIPKAPAGLSEVGLGAKEENIKVVVRVRPLINREIEYNQTHDKNYGAHGPGIGWITNKGKVIQVRDAKGAALPDANRPEWPFDIVFGKEHTTDDVYEQVAQEIIKSTMDGKNGTIFA